MSFFEPNKSIHYPYPMDFINILSKNRVTHGFHTKDYPRYFSYIRTKRKEPKYKSEYFLARYYLSRTNKKLAKKYIKKSYIHSKDIEIYSDYISGIYHASTNNVLALNKLKAARTAAASNFYFVKDIDEKIETLFNVLPEKIKTDWNGLTLEFVNNEERNCFDQHQKIIGSDYQTTIKNHIIIYEKRYKELQIYSKKNIKGIKNLYEKCKKLKECVDGFLKYLGDNFVDNLFMINLGKDTEQVFAFYENLFKYKNCNLKIQGRIDDFKVPASFEFLKDAIDFAKKNKTMSLKKAKELVGKEIEKCFKIEENIIKIPFLPVYYDLAYDYVQYPKEEDDSKVNKLLKGMAFFNK